jgi:GH25 family lysozyme M1 (1,4-beta-N-acetylmuramidase)
MQDFLSYIEGKTFEYPICFDYEDSTQQALSASTSQSICLTAMDMLAAEGYLVGMYTGKYFST